jgi:hypothetical protein
MFADVLLAEVPITSPTGSGRSGSHLYEILFCDKGDRRNRPKLMLYFTRCWLMACVLAVVANGWNLFVRLAGPGRHREAIASQPLLLQAIGRGIQQAG